MKREEALMSRLLRQSQFERRIAAELLHARHEKKTIIDSRISKEKDILEKREKEFLETMERERVYLFPFLLSLKKFKFFYQF